MSIGEKGRLRPGRVPPGSGSGTGPGTRRAPAGRRRGGEGRPLAFRGPAWPASPLNCYGPKLGPCRLYNPHCATHFDRKSALGGLSWSL